MVNFVYVHTLSASVSTQKDLFIIQNSLENPS